jgi:hypothetical protein
MGFDHGLNIMDKYVTWKAASYAMGSMLVASVLTFAWMQDTYASKEEVSEIKEILVKCLIEKRC